MTRTKLLIIGVVGIGLGTLIQLLPTFSYHVAIRRAMAHARAHPDLYHQRPGEACLPGYVRIPDAFSEGRETWDACWNGYAPPSIDFLLDDEDVALGAVVRQ